MRIDMHAAKPRVGTCGGAALGCSAACMSERALLVGLREAQRAHHLHA
jgi:hypothetical protein